MAAQGGRVGITPSVASLAVALALVLAFACTRIADDFVCARDDQCNDGALPGRCEPATHRCSFGDTTCSGSARRYGGLAGALAGSCVESGSSDGGSPDASGPTYDHVYFVAPNGDDANPGTEAQPFKTIGHGAKALHPGDLLDVEAGTYSEFLDSVPSGESWDRPVTIASHPSRSVVWHPPSSDVGVIHLNDTRYVVFDGFVIEGAPSVLPPIKLMTDHVRVQNCEVRKSNVAAIYVFAPADASAYGANELLRLDVHDNGASLASSSLAGGIELSSPGNVVRGCRVHDNVSVGIQVYASPSAAANDNRVEGNFVLDVTGSEGDGIQVSAAGAFVANNVVANVARYGVRMYGAEAGNRVLNNTIVGFGTAGFDLSSSSGTQTITNNIVRDPSGHPDALPSAGASNNIGNADPDPLFVAPQSFDFHLTRGSGAVDHGATLPDVTTDLEGTPRPQGAAYDIGAYELR